MTDRYIHQVIDAFNGYKTDMADPMNSSDNPDPQKTLSLLFTTYKEMIL